MIPPELIKKFPKLRAERDSKTSDPTRQYNCIAWSANRDVDQWWQPIKEEPWDFWPEGVPDDYSLESFVLIFEKLGYEKCRDNTFEILRKKVAIYADADGFTHVCDELNSGAWTSKLGPDEDIQHSSLECLEGAPKGYGHVRQVLRKNCNLLEALIRIYFKVIKTFVPSYRYIHKIKSRSK